MKLEHNRTRVSSHVRMEKCDPTLKRRPKRSPWLADQIHPLARSCSDATIAARMVHVPPYYDAWRTHCAHEAVRARPHVMLYHLQRGWASRASRFHARARTLPFFLALPGRFGAVPCCSSSASFRTYPDCNLASIPSAVRTYALVIAGRLSLDVFARQQSVTCFPPLKTCSLSASTRYRARPLLCGTTASNYSRVATVSHP